MVQSRLIIMKCTSFRWQFNNSRPRHKQRVKVRLSMVGTASAGLLWYTTDALLLEVLLLQVSSLEEIFSTID